MVLGKAEMADNIFDYDNCVIDQDANAKDQCKKSDAIDCVAEKVKNGDMVSASVTGIASSTTPESRHPRKSATSNVTESVASKRCSSNSSDFAFAVSP